MLLSEHLFIFDRLARVSLFIVLIFILCHSPKVLPSTFEILGYSAEVESEPQGCPIILARYAQTIYIDWSIKVYDPNDRDPPSIGISNLT